MHTLLLITLAVAPVTHHSARAEALFDQARGLLKENRAEEACPLFEQSQALEAGLGTLLNLADCYQRTGRNVRAYLRFNEAASWAERAGDALRLKTAEARAEALKPRLAWLTLTSAAPVPGLSVRVQEFQLELGAFPQVLPIDPGNQTLTAAAPGYQPWTQAMAFQPAEAKAVVVPALAEVVGQASLVPPLVAAPESTPAGQLSRPLPAPRRRGPVLLGTAGAVLLAAGGVGLGWSYSTYQRWAPRPAEMPAGQANAVRVLYPASWAAAGLGGALILTATGWGARQRPISVSPTPLPGGGAVAVTSSF